MADIKINGATPSAFYVGSTAATAVYYGSTKLWEAAPPTPVFPANTIRCKFSSGYTPTMGDTQTLVDASANIWDIYKSGTDWNSLFMFDSKLEEVIAANTTGVANMTNMFYSCYNLASVTLFDTSSVTSMKSMFEQCSGLTSVPLFDTSSVTNMASMFSSCENLTSVPLFNTSSVRDMKSMFNYCLHLESVPLFNTSSAPNMDTMFFRCYAVESGALALYRQASTQPIYYHDRTFKDCGKNTVTGAAELAQIPSDWGGNGA